MSKNKQVTITTLKDLVLGTEARIRERLIPDLDELVRLGLATQDDVRDLLDRFGREVEDFYEDAKRIMETTGKKGNRAKVIKVLRDIAKEIFDPFVTLGVPTRPTTTTTTTTTTTRPKTRKELEREKALEEADEETRRRIAETRVIRDTSRRKPTLQHVSQIRQVGRKTKTSYFFITLNTNIRRDSMNARQIEEMEQVLADSMSVDVSRLSNSEFAETFVMPAPPSKNPNYNKYLYLYANDGDDWSSHVKSFKVITTCVEVGGKTDYMHVHTLWSVTHDTRLTIDVEAVKRHMRGYFDEAAQLHLFPNMKMPKGGGVQKTPYVYVKGYGYTDNTMNIVEYILKTEDKDVQRRAFTPKGPSTGTYDMFGEDVDHDRETLTLVAEDKMKSLRLG